MAILNNLIVRGATRCLNTLYANSLQTDSQTISGNLTVNGYTYMGNTTTRTDVKLSVSGITNNAWYRSSGAVGWYNDSYGGGIYMTEPTYVKTYNNKAFYAYNGLYTGSTQQYYLNVNGKLNAADGVISNVLNVGNSLIGRNISATNLLRAAKYDLQTITQVGSNGTLYVAPSIQFPTSNTTSVAAASTSITIIDTNITSDVMAGVVWRPSAKVKISGTINGVVTGTVDGTITSINTSSKTMVIGNLSGGNWSSVVAGTYTKDKIENLNIMMYETYQNSTYYPVGILLTSYGSVSEHTDGTAKTFIDIYGGSATKPVVRLGSMTGLDAINGVTPSGWGLYTDHGYFNGLIVSTAGKIGGWSIGENSIYNNTNSMTSTAVGTFIGQAGFRNYQNSNTYVNIKDGVIEAKGVNLTGSITATSFSAYDSNNKERATVNTNGLIVKDASGNTVASLSNNLTIGQVAADKYNIYVNATSGIDIRNNTTSLANFGSSVRIGKIGQSRVEIDFHSLQLKDKEGNSYLHVSDLRNASGVAENVQEGFIGDGVTKSFDLFGGSGIQSISSVTIDGTATSAYTNPASGYDIVFNSAPADGAKVVVTYTTTSSLTKVYTFGKRSSDINVMGLYSCAEGYLSAASGVVSHAEGNGTTASGRMSHAEGNGTTASGDNSHAEGNYTVASGSHSHAEGNHTVANYYFSHAEGNNTVASGFVSHAEGEHTTASSYRSHAEGYYTTASGDNSHAGGLGTIARNKSQTAIGEYNIEDIAGMYFLRGTYAFIIGNGLADDTRSNALTVDWNGNVQMYLDTINVELDNSILTAIQSLGWEDDVID